VKTRKFQYATSENNADLLYSTGFRAPDDFGYLGEPGTGTFLLNDLEIDRAKRTCAWAEAVPYSEVAAKVRGKRRRVVPPARVIAAFLRAHKARRIVVPANFPLGLAKGLKREGIRVRPAKGAFWPQRALKSDEEIRHMLRATRIAESGMRRAMEVLKAAMPRRTGTLVWAKKTLTAEILRSEIEMAVVRAGGEARGDTIVACGEQACDPHERGSGALRANELIILDIFPRDARSGYHGDITRTVVKGRASEARRALWTLCLEAQKQALAGVRPGLDGAKLQTAIKDFFREAGYPDEIHNGRWRGFFHGLGHGLGLEVHEEPRVGATTFEPGQVVTIEPGIYWPGIGGVRHEDVIVVTESGSRQLTRTPKPMEI
jgi:Xaa-Pro aminopeptidase